MPQETSLDRRYIATIALIALLIIAIGLAAKRLFVPHDAPASTPVSEASALEQFSRENQLNDIATFINERIDASSAFVVWLSDSTASGVAWTTPDTLLTTTSDFLVRKVQRPDFDSTSVRIQIDTASVGKGWLVVVGRDAANRVVSWNGIGGGFTTTKCRSRQLDKIVISVPQAREFTGAGVFDLTGRLVGLVVNCGANGLTAIPPAEVVKTLSYSSLMSLDSAADSVRSSKPPAKKR
ncbi:MAG: hypothetical protein ABJC63_03810 [Gemmatimonadales bacterium]